VVTVLQVPPPAALVEEPRITCMPMGMGVGGQSGAVEKATRADRRRTTILSVVPFGEFIYFCFQVSSRKSDIAVIVFPLARVTLKYS
jgi:hypothetical protein